jgi:hypothetical protein
MTTQPIVAILAISGKTPISISQLVVMVVNTRFKAKRMRYKTALLAILLEDLKVNDLFIRKLKHVAISMAMMFEIGALFPNK